MFLRSALLLVTTAVLVDGWETDGRGLRQSGTEDVTLSEIKYDIYDHPIYRNLFDPAKDEEDDYYDDESWEDEVGAVDYWEEEDGHPGSPNQRLLDADDKRFILVFAYVDDIVSAAQNSYAKVVQFYNSTTTVVNTEQYVGYDSFYPIYRATKLGDILEVGHMTESVRFATDPADAGATRGITTRVMILTAGQQRKSLTSVGEDSKRFNSITGGTANFRFCAGTYHMTMTTDEDITVYSFRSLSLWVVDVSFPHICLSM